MAYREIADSEVEANAPVTVALVSALRDNLEAVIANDGTAPEIAAKALDDVPVGSGDTWQDVIGSRVVGTSYQNLTGQAIEVAATLNQTGNGGGSGLFEFQVSTNNSTWITVGDCGGTGSGNVTVCVTIANGEYYRATLSSGATGTIRIWAERRT